MGKAPNLEQNEDIGKVKKWPFALSIAGLDEIRPENSLMKTQL